MAEHKHCFECKGCYGYHYPSCSKHDGSTKTTSYEGTIAELEENAIGLQAGMDLQAAIIKDLEAQRDTTQATAQALAESLAFYRHQATKEIVTVPDLMEQAKPKPQDIPVRGGSLNGNTRR